MNQAYSLRTGRILFGFVFLLNPYFSTLDLLPDCIGYALILSGLGEVIWAVPSLTEAREKLLKLTLVSVIRMAAFLLVASVPSSESPTMALLAVTCLFAIELFYLIPLLRLIGDALSYLSVSLDGENPKIGYPNIRLRLFTILKLVFNLLPELCVLAVTEDGYIDSVTDNMSSRFLQLRNVLTVLLFALLLVFSLIALIGVSKWLKTIAKNAILLEKLRIFAEKHPEKAGKRTLRLTKTAMLIFSISLFLALPFRMDNFIFVPIFLGGIGFFLGGRILVNIEQNSANLPEIGAKPTETTAKSAEKATKRDKIPLVWSVLALVTFLSHFLFMAKYRAAGVAPGRGYEWFWGNAGLMALLGCTFVFVLVRLATKLVVFIDKNGFAKVESYLPRAAATAEKKKNSLILRLKLIPILAIITVFADVFEAATLFTTFGKDIEHAVPVWTILIALRLAFLVYTAITFGAVTEAVHERVESVFEQDI